jgi:hypothetical protein
VSNKGRGAAAEHALRPGGVLHACGGLGGGGATWRSAERASAGREAAAQVLGRHVARGKAAWRRRVRGTWPARAAGAAQRRNRGVGLEVDEGGSVCNFLKVQGPHYKA